MVAHGLRHRFPATATAEDQRPLEAPLLGTQPHTLLEPIPADSSPSPSRVSDVSKKSKRKRSDSWVDESLDWYVLDPPTIVSCDEVEPPRASMCLFQRRGMGSVNETPKTNNMPSISKEVSGLLFKKRREAQGFNNPGQLSGRGEGVGSSLEIDHDDTSEQKMSARPSCLPSRKKKKPEALELLANVACVMWEINQKLIKRRSKDKQKVEYVDVEKGEEGEGKRIKVWNHSSNTSRMGTKIRSRHESAPAGEWSPGSEKRSCGMVTMIRSRHESAADGEWYPGSEEEKRKRKGKSKATNNDGKNQGKDVKPPGQATIELVHDAVRRIGGSPPVFLISKSVEASDVDKGQHRLLLPKREELTQKLEGVLSPEEMRKLKSDDPHKNAPGLDVMVLDKNGGQYAKAKLRYLNSNRGFRITGEGYWSFVLSNGLKKDSHSVHLWLFHVNRHLAAGGGNVMERDIWLALVHRKEEACAEPEAPSEVARQESSN